MSKLNYSRIKRFLPTQAQQRGVSLIEAMVSMVVLALGVLVLMIAQLRSVSSVQEAENQTLVAQAAQTLMEGMLINPVLTKNPSSNITQRNYDSYLNNDVMNMPCSAGAINYVNNSAISKADLAQNQLCRFKHELSTKLPNTTDIIARICRGNPANGNCNSGDDNYIIVVSWKMQARDTSDTNVSDSLGIGDDGLLTYRYILPVQE